MDIIRRGNGNKLNNPKRFVCSNCECVFIANNTEYTIRQCDYDGSEEYTVNCPECGAVVSNNDKGCYYFDMATGKYFDITTGKYFDIESGERI